MKSSENQKVKKYIKNLKRHLAHLSEADKNDIVKEIESHIIEKWETDSKGAFDEESLSGVLGKLGNPEVIAAQYCEHRGWAVPPKRHTLRNGIIIAIAVFAFGTLGLGYVAVKYVAGPILGWFASDEKIVEINDDGIRVLGGKISVTDDGISIGGKIDVSQSGVKIDGTGNFNFDFDFDSDIFEAGKEIASEAGKISIPASKAKAFSIDTKNGKITIRGADTSTIEMTFTKKAFGSDAAAAREAIEGTKIEYEFDDDTVAIKSSFPDEKPHGVSSLGIDYDMRVPFGLAASIDAKNMMLDLANLQNDVTVDGKNGKVKISNVNGTVGVDFKNGAVEAEMIVNDANIAAKNSVVKLTDVKGNAAVENLNGKLAIEGIGNNLNVDSKSSATTISGVHGNINVDTKMGSLKLTLLPDYEFTLNGESKLGSFNCDFPTKTSGSNISAVVGSGRRAVNIDSKMGSVNITSE